MEWMLGTVCIWTQSLSDAAVYTESECMCGLGVFHVWMQKTVILAS